MLFGDGGECRCASFLLFVGSGINRIHQFLQNHPDCANCIIITSNRVGYQVRIGVRIHDRNGGDAKPIRFGHGNRLSLGINNDQGIR